MTECRFTLLTDGAADVALVHPIRWALSQNPNLDDVPFSIEWADLARLPRVPKGLAERINAAIEYFECDVLLVHRDAETATRQKRVDEVMAAIEKSKAQIPYTCVITVRMQEAWMLIDEAAIRSAAGNPNGSIVLDLPRVQKIEEIPDPKALFHNLLRDASELTGRRLKKFTAASHAHRVCELIGDWSTLRKLSAFVAFEEELDKTLASMRFIR